MNIIRQLKNLLVNSIETLWNIKETIREFREYKARVESIEKNMANLQAEVLCLDPKHSDPLYIQTLGSKAYMKLNQRIDELQECLNNQIAITSIPNYMLNESGIRDVKSKVKYMREWLDAAEAHIEQRKVDQAKKKGGI